jgi:hypothetical protein
MDDQLFGFKRYNPGDRDAILHQLAETAVQQGGCITADIHDYVFDPVLFPAWRDTYRNFIAYLNQRGDFWLALPREISQHWSERYRKIVSQSSGLAAGFSS